MLKNETPRRFSTASVKEEITRLFGKENEELDRTKPDLELKSNDEVFKACIKASPDVKPST